MHAPAPASVPLHLIAAAALSVFVTSATSASFVVFDEARDGDASDNRFAPTTVALGAGVNTIRGFSGQSPTPDVHDLDYITFTVAEGFRLDSFVLQSASVGGAFSFVGLQAGPIVTIPADWTSIETPLLGWAHFGSADVGVDLLPVMSASPGSVGFSGPLAAGTYALWIMELDTSKPHTYSFGLGVTAVPAPSVLALAAACGLLPRRRARGFRAN
ncbi:MAG: hypothetical protein NTU45_04190 [Planctomycetota bacterium]|nr:hypothetical protein [Planctomycetota bacterium]